MTNGTSTTYYVRDASGNVMAIVSDDITREEDDNYITRADVVSTSDYYPFGLSYNEYYNDRSDRNEAEATRYGFNGKERDKSFGASSVVYDYGFRIYNPEIGKFLSVDPLTDNYPFYSPYQFAANTPILAVDIDGLESDIVINKAEEFLFTPYEWGGKNPDKKFVGYVRLKPKDYQRIKPMLVNIKHLEPSYMRGKTIPNLVDATGNKSWSHMKVATNEQFKKLRAQVYDNIGDISDGFNCGVDCSGLIALAYAADKELVADLSFEGSSGGFTTFSNTVDNLGVSAAIVFQDVNSISEADILYKPGHMALATGNVIKDGNGNISAIEIIESAGGKGVNRRFMEKGEFGKYKFVHPFRTSDPGYMKDPTNRFDIWRQTIEKKQTNVKKEGD